MRSCTITIDDRAVLSTLDRLYRKAMQTYESTVLLSAARRLATVLDAAPAPMAPEGYYGTSPALTEYFLLMRTLQQRPASDRDRVSTLHEFTILWNVATSSVFGLPAVEGTLLPTSVDALGRALERTAPEWSLSTVVAAAELAAIEFDDYSLVGLAALVEDAVVLAAVRESMVLYASLAMLGLPEFSFEWKVQPALERQANRFVTAFNQLVPGAALPEVTEAKADRFFDADARYPDWAGRCVRIGVDPLSRPARHYHWAICEQHGQLRVQDFWSEDVWTSDRFKAERTRKGRCILP